MLVTLQNFKQTVEKFSKPGKYGLDCETTGLRLHHGDRLFSIILSDGEDGYYFNFQPYGEASLSYELDRGLLPLLQRVFGQQESTWYAHNAKFDLHALRNEGLEVRGTVHCTKAIALVEYNEHLKYSLDSCAERLGEKKDDAVEQYIKENKLSRKTEIPGKKTKQTVKDFTAVPFDIIAPYGIKDALLTYKLGTYQERRIAELDSETKDNTPKLRQVMENERRLTSVLQTGRIL
jgi:DNA polymerase I-like protein with 3'-5' exonuclease and polymerase domains